jgi:transcriptional regulator with XRE-family HTH domain
MRRKLETARHAAGLTQGQAGALIGKTQSHYGKVERGIIGLSADEALVLTEKLGITLADLVEIEGVKPANVIMKVCSHKPSAFGADKGTWHITGDGKRSWCGRDVSEWLRIGELEDHELASAYCCTRCRAAGERESK